MEIDLVRDSILKIHHQDEFYFYLRFMPSVRVSTDEFTLTKSGIDWQAKYYKTTFNPPPWEGTNRTPRKKTLKVSELSDTSLTTFLNNIDVNKLITYTNADSIPVENSKLLIGTFNYYMIICSNKNVKLIEYPVIQHYDTNKDWTTQNIYWQSKFLDDLIEKIKRAISY